MDTIFVSWGACHFLWPHPAPLSPPVTFLFSSLPVAFEYLTPHSTFHYITIAITLQTNRTVLVLSLEFANNSPSLQTQKHMQHIVLFLACVRAPPTTRGDTQKSTGVCTRNQEVSVSVTHKKDNRHTSISSANYRTRARGHWHLLSATRRWHPITLSVHTVQLTAQHPAERLPMFCLSIRSFRYPCWGTSC